MPLDDVLLDLKLAPDALEVPVPRYFVEDKAKVGIGQRWEVALGCSGQGRGGAWGAQHVVLVAVRFGCAHAC